MPKARSTSYNLGEEEAVENNSEIARKYGISESIVRRLTARLNCQGNGRQWDASRRSIRSSELDQRILEWFTEQRSQGKFSVEH